MASDFPRRPAVQKGALAVYPTHTPGAQPSAIVVFQFNPDQLKRTIAHRAPAPAAGGSAGPAKEDVLRVMGPPVETLSLTVALNAADQLADPARNAATAEHGLHAALARLELLMYPPTLEARRIEQLAAQGEVQIAPADVPLVLFIWGRSRVLPVKITSFVVTEEAFDTRLNPIHAKVELGLQVLTYVEFPKSSIGRDAFISYQAEKERLSALDVPGPRASGLRNLLPAG